MSATYTTEGIILQRRDMGEADRMLTILTIDRGIVKAIARGTRLPKSKLGGFLDLYAHVELALAEGKQLDTVTEVKSLSSNAKIRSSAQLHVYAGYLSELAIKVAIESNTPDLFKLVMEAFAYLQGSTQPTFILETFRLRLLSILGYHPNLMTCARCHAALAEEVNFVSYALDEIVCPDCHEGNDDPMPRTALSPNALKLLRLMFTADYEKLGNIRTSPDVASEVAQLTERLVAYHLDVKLKSTVTLHQINSESVKVRL